MPSERSTSAAADARAPPATDWLQEVAGVVAGSGLEAAALQALLEQARAEPLPPGWRAVQQRVPVLVPQGSDGAGRGRAMEHEVRTVFQDVDTGAKSVVKPTDTLYAALAVAMRRHSHVQKAILEMAVHVKTLVELRTAATTDVKAK